MTITFIPPKPSKNQRNANLSFRVNLCVPFYEKDQAKQLGAWWDSDKKTWFVMLNANKVITPFLRWVKNPIIDTPLKKTKNQKTVS